MRTWLGCIGVVVLLLLMVALVEAQSQRQAELTPQEVALVTGNLTGGDGSLLLPPRTTWVVEPVQGGLPAEQLPLTTDALENGHRLRATFSAHLVALSETSRPRRLGGAALGVPFRSLSVTSEQATSTTSTTGGPRLLGG